MLNRFFSKQNLKENKSETVLEYDLKNFPKTEEELNSFVKYAEFLLVNMKKSPITEEGLRELLEEEGCVDRYGSEFCEYIKKLIKKAKPSELDRVIRGIVSVYGFMSYKFNPNTHETEISFDEYVERGNKFIIEAEQIPFIPNLIDVRTMCYQLRQSLSEGVIKAANKYSEALIELSNKIEALEGLKHHYLPPAECVYQVNSK